jgi:hypothetical protein
MNATLFSEVQRLFERTYENVGINLEDCLIDSRRCAQLTAAAGDSADELSELARTFLRTADDCLYVGIYYSSGLIEQLEQHDPRAGLSDTNIPWMIMFVEEINHAVHAALQFKAGWRRIDREDFACNLELQGMVDTYLVLLLFATLIRKSRTITLVERAWLKSHLFEAQQSHAYKSRRLKVRYRETRELAARYTEYLDTIDGAERLNEIRHFHGLSYESKARWIGERTDAIRTAKSHTFGSPSIHD